MSETRAFLPEQFAPVWSFVLTDTKGQQIGGLSMARSRSLSFDLRGPASAKWTMDARHPQTYEVQELRTDLVVYRDKRRLFRGRIGATDDDIGSDRHTTNFSAVDYRGLMAARIDRTGRYYYDWNQYDICWNLILQVACAGEGGDLGLTHGQRPTHNILRTETIDEDTPIDKAVDRFQDYEAGFEWWIDPELRVNMATWRGQMRQWDFPMAWGTTGLAVRRSFDTEKAANWVRVKGGKLDAPPDSKMVSAVSVLPAWGQQLFDAWWVGTSSQEKWLYVWTGQRWEAMMDMPTPQATRQAPNLRSLPEGRIDRVVNNSDLKSQTAVDRAADAALEEGLAVPSTYTATLQTGMWSGPDQAWLGDRIPIVLKTGRLDVVTTGRIYQIDITVDDDGAETVDLTFGEVTGESLEVAGRPLGAGMSRESLGDRVERLERRRFENLVMVMSQAITPPEEADDVGMQSETRWVTTDNGGSCIIRFPQAYTSNNVQVCVGIDAATYTNWWWAMTVEVFWQIFDAFAIRVFWHYDWPGAGMVDMLVRNVGMQITYIARGTTR